MSTSLKQPLTSLQMSEDRDYLNQLVGEVSTLLDQQREVARHVAASVRKLSDFCAERFHDEETSPLYAKAEEVPGMRLRIQRVKQQHDALQHQLEHLVQAWGSADVPSEDASFQAEFAGFCQSLLRHEREEIHLWQAAYRHEEGTKD